MTARDYKRKATVIWDEWTYLNPKLKTDKELKEWAQKNRPKQFKRYSEYATKASQLAAQEKAANKDKPQVEKNDVLPKKKEDKTKQETKKTIQDVSKNILKDYSYSRAAAQKKKKRDKAIAEAKKKGEPLAPNGLAYENNDIKYLTSKGYTKEAAIALLAKDSKYTTKHVEAPNGAFYSENDIKYLVNNGYTREDAIKYLSKTSKYKKASLSDIISDNKEAIKEASDNYVHDQVDKLLDKEVEKFAGKFGIKANWSAETKEKIRAMIRGEQNIVFANDEIVNGAQEATEKALNDVFDKQIHNRLNDAEKFAQAKVDDAINKIQEMDYKYLRLKTADIEKMLNGKIENQLKGSGAVQKYSNMAADLDKKLAKLHINANLQGQLGKSIERISANISKQLAEKIQPQIAKQREVVQRVTSQLQEYKKKITAIKEKALARIEGWKNEAQARIKAEEKRIINSALGSLKQGLSGIKLKF